MIEHFLRLRRLFVVVLRSSLIFLVFTLVLVGFVQVILRKFLNSSIPDADLLLTMLVYYIALFGSGLATFKDNHITIEVVSNFVSERTNEAFKLISNLFSAWIVWILCRAAQAYIELQEGSIDLFMSLVPTHYVEAIILPTFALMSFGFLLNAIINIFILADREAANG